MTQTGYLLRRLPPFGNNFRTLLAPDAIKNHRGMQQAKRVATMAAFDFSECERRLQQVIKTSAPCTSVQPQLAAPTDGKHICPPGEISLSDEQLAMLGEPLDPRVVRILAEIGEDAEQIQNEMHSKRIIHFPFVGSAPGHAIRDCEGKWTVVSGEPPQQLNAAR